MSDTETIHLIVLFGGQSAEHDISCMTAAHVISALDRSRYEITCVGITREGDFLATELPVSSTVEALEPKGEITSLSLEVANSPADAITVVLPLLHGPLGEDGTVQGMCELAGVAYVGAGVLGSAVAMDKAMTKTIMDAHGIKQANWLPIRAHELQENPEILDDAIEKLGLPIFVKPANMGSSVGVSKADSRQELALAMDKALQYDELLVLEEAVDAREIEVALLGNHNIKASVLGEIIPGADFYDYEDKYYNGAAELIIPAELPATISDQLEQIALEAYQALRVEGLARADFLYEQQGRGLLLNELNTMPGFTPISMYPKLWQASGLAYAELIDQLVNLALERHRRRSSKRTVRP